HSRHITDSSLLSLIEVVLRGNDGSRQRGIDQGSPYSPTALNVRLHHAHDLGFVPGHHPSWFRYADNVVYLCQYVSEGNQALEHATSLLEKAGLSLKGKDGPPVDLRQGQKTQLLGFTLRHRDGRAEYGLGGEAWEGLEQDLVKAHEAVDP